MHHQRWLMVAVCFCIFTGCVACQSNYDYCGPMPEQGGDFMYRKNSVLGGDPTITPIDQQPENGDQDDEDQGPEPTPAPAPDEAPRPSLEMEDGDLDSETTPPDEANPQAANEVEDEPEAEAETETVSTLQWHTPSRRQPSEVKQVRFISK